MRNLIKIINFLPFLLMATAAPTPHRMSGPTGKKGYRRRNRPTARKLNSKSMNVADLSVNVASKSGSVSINRINLGSKRDKKSSVSIKVDELREVDSTGKVVGKVGGEKHSIRSFAAQDFTFGVDEYDVPIETVGNSTNSTDDTDVGGNNSTDVAKGARITFDTTLDTGSKLQVQILLISGAGEIGTVTERWSVQPGDMKFNIDMSEWQWCDPCVDGTGEFVEIDIEIKGSKTSVDHVPGQKKTYVLGDGATLELSDQILLDGNWSTMPDGYPMTELKGEGNKQVYTFRFPKFEENAFYDPILTFSGSATIAGSGIVIATAGLITYYLL